MLKHLFILVSLFIVVIPSLQADGSRAWQIPQDASVCEIYRQMEGTDALPNACKPGYKPRKTRGFTGSKKRMYALKPIEDHAPKIVAGKVMLPILFAFDSDELTPESRQTLDKIGKVMQMSGGTYDLVGHSDRVGEDQYNLDLSWRRALVVQGYLSSSHGVSPNKMQVRGRGFHDLYDPYHPLDASNRRVEFSTTKPKGG